MNLNKLFKDNNYLKDQLNYFFINNKIKKIKTKL